MSRDGCVALPRGAIGLSAVCDCGISWSYSLFLKTKNVGLLFEWLLKTGITVNIHVDKISTCGKDILDIILGCEWITKAIIWLRGVQAGRCLCYSYATKSEFLCGSNYYHGVLRRAYFDGFQIVGVCFIAEFSFPFCCLFLTYTRPNKKRRLLSIHCIWGVFHQSLSNDVSQFERWF